MNKKEVGGGLGGGVVGAGRGWIDYEAMGRGRIRRRRKWWRRKGGGRGWVGLLQRGAAQAGETMTTATTPLSIRIQRQRRRHPIQSRKYRLRAGGKRPCYLRSDTPSSRSPSLPGVISLPSSTGSGNDEDMKELGADR